MVDRVTSLRKKLKRYDDERWQLLYRKKRPWTEEQKWLIEHYHEGISRAAEHFGISLDALRKRVRTIRYYLKRNGDDRLRIPRKEQKPAEVKTDVLPNYGVVHAPSFCKDKDMNPDPRPSWLVINYTV